MKFVLRRLEFAVLALLTLFLCRPAQAQAPAAIAGWTFDVLIAGGDYPYASSGRYRLVALNAGGQYRVFNIFNVPDSTGSFTFTRNDINTGTFRFDDSIAGTNFSQVFSFSPGGRSGSYTLSNPEIPGSQVGYFFSYAGTAPVSLANKQLRLTVLGATAPFDAEGTYRVLTLPNGTFVTEKTPGVTNSVGTFSYFTTNRSSGVMTFSDSLYGTGFNLLSFADDSSGAYLIRGGSGGYQFGQFTIVDLRPVTFVAQPSSQTVAVGEAVTLSATAAGTKPISYQWLKNDVPIDGATGTSYSINFAQTSDSGTYRVVARNPAGSNSSTGAVLTVLCRYTLGPEFQTFPATGGTGSVTVGAAGTCPWTVSNPAPWVTITSGTSGSGLGSVQFTVAANTNAQARAATITIGGRLFTVSQLGALAPDDLQAGILALTITSGTNGYASEGSLVIRTHRSTNTYEALPSNQSDPPETGTYAYVRTSGTVGLLQRPDQGSAADLVLNFESAARGTFLSTNDAGGFQSGQFVLIRGDHSFNPGAFEVDPDLLFQAPNGSLVARGLAGTSVISNLRLQGGTALPPEWRPAATGDFNHDHFPDVLFQHQTGRLAIWTMQATNRLNAVSVRSGATPGAHWRALTVADFNDDGHADILLQHSNGKLQVWFMHGTVFLVANLLRNGIPAGEGWRVVGASDMNGDGQSDLVFQHITGRLRVWHFVAGQFAGSALLRNGTAAAGGWRAVGLHDFNDDGHPDVLFQNQQGRLAAWLMNGENYVGAVALPQNLAGQYWRFIGPK